MEGKSASPCHYGVGLLLISSWGSGNEHNFSRRGTVLEAGKLQENSFAIFLSSFVHRRKINPGGIGGESEKSICYYPLWKWNR